MTPKWKRLAEKEKDVNPLKNTNKFLILRLNYYFVCFAMAKLDLYLQNCNCVI